jgi:thiamine pyrophosphate-dependent acetolactate synthase large subunit-like protein
VARPPNLDIVVIDNHHYGETGMQMSHTGRGIDLAKVAEACGFAQAATLTAMDEVERLCLMLRTRDDGPRLFVIRVAAQNPPRSLPSRDAVYIKNRFRAHLGFPAG